MAKDQTDGALEWLGVQYRILQSREDTGGAISVVDSTAPPGSGPPRHVHDDADETFVVLEGEAEFWLEGELFAKSAGGSVFVPRGKEHTFRVTGTKPSRHLVILTPGGFEAFFAEMAAGAYRIPEDMEKITAIAAQHHLRFTGPPLSGG